jgi:hypothetical protein
LVVISWPHPRTAWGDPDLEASWTSDNNFSIPLERPPAGGAADGRQRPNIHA